MFNEPFGLAPSRWIGTPVWLFAVPFLSFLIFDRTITLGTPMAYLARSLVEIIVLFHVWSYIWVWTQLLLEWAWILIASTELGMAT
jgi:hypothetical protein